MDLLIHTLGRAQPHLQHTLKSLRVGGIEPTLVIQEHESDNYHWYTGPKHFLPPHLNHKGLTATRDYIIHDMPGDDHVIFMDDDLHFAVRRDDDPTKFRQPTGYDILVMLSAMDRKLNAFPMVGIGAREGGNRVTAEYVYNSRIMRVLGFRRSYLKRHHLTFSPLVVMEDFHINLQILRSGADTCICNRWVSNQAGGSDAPGGCSTYRSDAVQTAAAHALAARHPGYVRVVQKATKTAWGGGTRTDVVVQWKKARAGA